VLTPDELKLGFTSDAARALYLERECRFPLEVDAASREQLREGLRRVLTGGRHGRATPAELVL
jgi:hypothetical protein